MRFLVFLMLFFIPFCMLAQVNAERFRKEYDQLGFSITNTTGFDFSSGNTEELEFSEALRLDWNNPIQDYYAILEYDFKTVSKEKTKDKGFFHFRTIRDLKDYYMMTELFTQLEMDRFLNLRSRFLLGGGLRMDLVALFASVDTTRHNVKLFAGIGIMYENEAYSYVQDIYISHFRSTNYLSMVMSLSENVDFTVVNYYQPALEDFNDYRFITDIKLRVRLISQLSVQFSTSYKHRNVVVDDTFKDDLEIKTAIVIKL
ncbi:MAG: DUF481 domain-containing protein [Bacteroidetes bacterium]|nr:DUF481 domain-containing protein [Bacteroidota bacterium]